MSEGITINRACPPNCKGNCPEPEPLDIETLKEGRISDMKIWVLTSEYNEYGQEGDYFICAWKNKPTHKQLKNILSTTDIELVEHVLSGGGRKGTEFMWYNLIEYTLGEEY